MKGIILAGGTGSRLRPLTLLTNKHLLPVAGNFMITYPIQILSKSGIKDILIITGRENCGDFMKLLGSGKDFGCSFTYKIQDEAGGIAQALSLAKDFANEKPIIVILGDNHFEDDIKDDIRNFKEGAKVFLKEVKDAQRFGVAEIKGDKVIGIEEKPEKPKSNLAVTGLYIYDSKVFDIIKTLKPSKRGELEITDVNNFYIKEGKMRFKLLNDFWSDMGTPESLQRTSEFLSKKKQ
jgi:glucose-1-phosphate thymidylyltransferase